MLVGVVSCVVPKTERGIWLWDEFAQEVHNEGGQAPGAPGYSRGGPGQAQTLFAVMPRTAPDGT